MKFRLFISSVQKEFAKERRKIARYVRKDALFGLPAPGFAEGVDFRAVLKRKSLGSVVETQVKTQAANEETPKTDVKTGVKIAGALNGALKTSSGASNGALIHQVFNLIATEAGINRARLEEKTQVSSRTLDRVVAFLITLNFIERRGSKKTGGYFVVEHHFSDRGRNNP